MRMATISVSISISFSFSFFISISQVQRASFRATFLEVTERYKEGCRMTPEKKGFVLYFDTYPWLSRLGPEQRGWVLSAIFTFAKRAADEERISPEEVLEQFPELSPDAAMAYGFICSAISRDTQKWKRRCQTTRERQEKGSLQKTQDSGDHGWMRSLIEQRKLLE
jgi:hypothetical protein